MKLKQLLTATLIVLTAAVGTSSFAQDRNDPFDRSRDHNVERDRGFDRDRDRGFGQNTPPDWAIGTFRGYSPKYKLDVELRIDPRGHVFRYIWSRKNTRPDSAEGSWERGKLVFGGDTYYLSRRGGGIRTVKSSDPGDYTNFSRTGTPDRLPIRTDVPDWAIGTFRGFNRKYNLEVEINITARGAVHRVIWNDKGRPDSADGNFQDNQLVFGRDRYDIFKAGSGVHTIKVGDERDETDFRRR